MQKVMPVAWVVVLTLASSRSLVVAAGPTIEQILAFKPSQAAIVYDTPAQSAWEQCKLEVLKSPASGWILRDHRGLIVRRFLDSNADNVVDQWSYYMNGQEVFRDVDANFNGKPDQYRWYHAAGSRWGVDANEDGRVDEWRTISADEASAEAIAALAARDAGRLRCLLLTDDDMKDLGLASQTRERVRAAIERTMKDFDRLAGTVSPSAHWVRLDAQHPVSVPAEDVGGAKDLVMYHNATIIAEVSGQSRFLRAVELVKVGDTWKFCEAPAVMNPDKPLESAGVLVPSVERIAVTTGAQEPQNNVIEDNPEIRELVATLQKFDQDAPNDGEDVKALIQYHLKRADLCARIAAKSARRDSREHWYEQTADSLNAAAQTGQYPNAITTLDQYSEQFNKTSWGKDLAAYFKYRALNAAYALELSKPSTDHAKAQEAFLVQLEVFLKEFPQAQDAPDALFQMGNGLEFAGKLDAAKSCYSRLATEFPKSAHGPKGAGALRRLQSVGQPFQLVGNSLTVNGSIDVTRLRGKVVLISYWATWCEPCKAELGRLKKIREKFGPQGFEIIGVCLDADPQKAKAYVEQNDVRWPQIYEKGEMDSLPAVNFGIISLPYLVLLDGEGRVIDNNLQFHQLEQEVERALAKKVAVNR
jgi:thiol-disulfide isomerase/thioredoxin/TolA-binding protein